MEQELIPIFIAVVVSAVMQVELLRTYAVIELSYKLIQLSAWFLHMAVRSSKQEKSPSNSDQLNGHRPKRR